MTTTAAVRAGADLVVSPERDAPLPYAEAGATVAEIVRALGDVEGLIRSATAWRTELLEAARQMVAAEPQAILAPELAIDVWSSSDGAELAQRALVADVATALEVHERTAARLFDEAQVLVGDLSATVAGMRAGAVSYRHAQALVEHTGDLDGADRRAVEAEALRAVAMPPGAFARHVRRLRERLLAEPVSARHERAASRRSVRIEPARDGMAFLTAYLPAATACAVGDRLDRAVDALRDPGEPRTADQLRADVLAALLLDDGTLDHGLFHLAELSLGATEASEADGGGTAPVSGDPEGGSEGAGGRAQPEGGWRSGVRERLDVLARAPIEPDDSPPRVQATRAAMARLARGIVPHVTVTVPVLTLLRTLACPDGGPPDSAGERGLSEPPITDSDAAGAPPDGRASAGPDEPPAAPSRGRADAGRRPEADVAHLDGYGPIDDRTATILAARAPSFRRLLTDPHTGAVLAVGRDTYAVPADLRAFLRLRDETCRFPGCSRAADRCDLDHTRAWVSGGTTDVTNLAHLCRTHHRLKHGTRWDVRQVGNDGTLSWTSPTRRRHVTTPTLALAHDGPPPPF
ncbi:MAG TPA: DUF222 domain-containing protein [Luteimicrobium sp.]|nr:DUF222 domain-containing protein [Luteimicrobium sp.]